MSKYKWRDIFRAAVCRRSFLFKQTRRTKTLKISEGNRGTCCQGKRSLLKNLYICLMKIFRLHCLQWQPGGEKSFHTQKTVCCASSLRASHVLCAARKIA